MAVDSDITADDLGMFNLDPGVGNSPAGPIMNVTSVPRQVYPQTTADLIAPTSITQLPTGANKNWLVPGQAVNLAPPNPVNVGQPTPTAAPVIPQGSVAPPVQLAQNGPVTALPAAAPVPVAPAGPPQTGRAGPMPGAGQGIGGTVLQPPVAATPDANPHQQIIDNYQKELARLRSIADNPQSQLWFGASNKAARDQIPEIEKKIAEQQQILQTQQTNLQLSKNYGLTRQMPSTADAAALQQEAMREWKEEGNYDAYKALVGAGQGAQANLYKPEAMQSLNKSVDTARGLYSTLDKDQPEATYKQARQEVLNKAKSDPGAQKFGLTEGSIPATKAEYDAKKTLIQAKLRGATNDVMSYKRELDNQGVPQPVANKEAGDAIIKSFPGAQGDPVGLVEPVTLTDMGGQQGAQAQPGSKDLGKFGPSEKGGTWSDMNKDRRDEITKSLGTEQMKGTIGQYKMAKAFSQAAYNDKLYTSAGGVAFIEDALGAIGRDVAEGSKAAGSIGLVKILDSKFGGIGNFLNKSATEWSEYKAWIDGGKKGNAPRLSQNTIDGIKEIAKFKMDETTKELGRLEGPIAQLGRYGGSLKEVGLDDETQKLLDPIHNTALAQGRLIKDSYPSVIRGDRRVFLPQGTTGPGVIPAGSYAAGVVNTASKAAPPAPAAPAPGQPPVQPVVNGGQPLPGQPPAGGGFTSGTPAGGYPAPITSNPVARTVYGSAGQTAQNLGAPPTVAGNTALVTASSAASESGYRPNDIHDNGIGYGLFGHNNNGGRLADMQKFAGVPVTGKPGAPIPPEVQSAFYAREIQTAAQKDPFIAKTLADPNASAEDLARVQVRMERPAGYTGPGSEEKASGWANRLASTRELMGQKGTAAAQPAAQPQGWASRVNQMFTQGVRGSGPMGRATPQEASEAAIKPVAALATPVLATGGAIGGGAVGGFPGAVAGGMTGGAAGKSLQEYLTKPEGEANYPAAITEGAGEGLIAAIPGGGVLPTAARVIGGGLVGGGGEAIRGGTTGEVFNAAVGGVLGAAGGEAFGRTLGMVGHQIYNRFSGAAKAEIQDAAKILAEQKPRIVDATGKSVENTAYTKAKATVESAGLDAEHVAYAYNQVANKSSKGEAFTQRPGEVARMKAAEDLQNIQDFVGNKAVEQNISPKSPAPGAPFKPIKDGPIDSINTGPNSKGKIDAQYLPEAKQAEFMLQKDAANMNERWGNGVEARAELLAHERTAIRNGDMVRAKAMRDIADTIRVQQERMVKQVLPKEQSDALIQHLKNADNRYRNAVLAGGEDIVGTIAKGGSKGNQAKAAFDSLAHDDPIAQRWTNSLVRAERRGANSLGMGALLGATTAAHFVLGPAATAVGAVVSINKAKQMLMDYMLQKGAGKQVNFAQLVAKEFPQITAGLRQGGAAVGTDMGVNTAKSLVAPSGQSNVRVPIDTTGWGQGAPAGNNQATQ